MATVVTLLLLLSLAGCKKRPQRKIECVDSAARLQRVLDRHTEVDTAHPTDDHHLGLTLVEGNPESLAQDLRRHSVICPTDDDARLMRAVVAMVDRDRPEATRILDELLARRRSYPEAAVLRARLAIDVGGIDYARELLERQVRFRPDSAALQETLAATLYADGDYDDALEALDRAEGLGAPGWRIDFNRGLIAEELGEIEAAKGLYDRSARANPAWPHSRARLRGLQVLDSISETGR